MTDDTGRALMADLCRLPNPDAIDRTAVVELGVTKVGVLGHSWGSIVGITLAERHPDLLWGYVGVGQVICGRENEVESFEFAMYSAAADRNDEALADLRALGEYPGSEPLTLDRIGTCRRWAQHYGGLSAYRSDAAYLTGSEVLSPYYTDDELALIGKGQQATLPRVLSEILTFDARDQVDFDVPLLMFLGRHDRTTPTAPVERWIDSVSAPSKDVVWFENSAHLCMHEEPGRFVVSLVNRALPHALAA